MSVYAITGPACVSFSGGRTSAYMLRRILDAHQGNLPNNVRVVFANTGKERPETLDFVRNCGRNWGVDIVWLEYAERGVFRQVTYESASRDGTPFETLIRERKWLPSPVQRFCTVELKIKTMHRYLRSIGWKEWQLAVGLRADEMHRVSRILNREKTPFELVRCPLATDGITQEFINAWWKLQSFDLSLQSYQGNCDLCFLKGESKRLRIISEQPELANWWIERERERNSTFRPHSRSYEKLLTSVRSQLTLPVFQGDQPDDIGDCACTD